MSHIRFKDAVSDDEDYGATDSDDELDDNEKELLLKARVRKEAPSDSENEIYGVHSDDDESNNASDLAQSDIEGNEDDDLPDIRAWGKNKRNFYSTDYVDQDYGGFDGRDAVSAEVEEEEAKSLQKKLAEQLDDDDFNLEFFTKTTTDSKRASEEVIQSDFSKLSKRQKIQFLQKDSPELFGLIVDIKEKMCLVKVYLAPIIISFRQNKIPQSDAMDFVIQYYELIMHYCLNVRMYLVLKSTQQNVKNHPVVKRLYQYRQLIMQMSAVFDETIRSQIDTLLKSDELIESQTPNPLVRKNKNLSNEQTLIKKVAKKKKRLVELNGRDEPDAITEFPPKKQLKLASAVKKSSRKSEADPEKKLIVPMLDNIAIDSNKVDADEDDFADELGDDRRAITYQMAKNKGLMPRRKKEQRNPRVKHRNKFKKAKIRRKGAVRDVRMELSRYGGEISGIKATVTKSIKIKS